MTTEQISVIPIVFLTWQEIDERLSLDSSLYLWADVIRLGKEYGISGLYLLEIPIDPQENAGVPGKENLLVFCREHAIAWRNRILFNAARNAVNQAS